MNIDYKSAKAIRSYNNFDSGKKLTEITISHGIGIVIE